MLNAEAKSFDYNFCWNGASRRSKVDTSWTALQYWRMARRWRTFDETILGILTARILQIVRQKAYNPAARPSPEDLESAAGLLSRQTASIRRWPAGMPAVSLIGC